MNFKPCPFCGSKEIGETLSEGFHCRTAYCRSCGAKAQSDKWNKRATPIPSWLDESMNSGDGTYKP